MPTVCFHAGEVCLTRHKTDRQTSRKGWRTDRQAYTRTGTQTDAQTGICTDRQTNKQMYGQTGEQISRHPEHKQTSEDRQADVYRQTDRQTDRRS